MLVRSVIYGVGFDFKRPFQEIDKLKLVDFFIHCESNGISSWITFARIIPCASFF